MSVVPRASRGERVKIANYILACLACGMRTSRIEASHRRFRVGMCGHCGDVLAPVVPPVVPSPCIEEHW